MVITAIWVDGQAIVDTNKLWNNVVILESTGYSATETIRFTYDIVINSQTYKSVERSIDEAQQNWNNYGYIREDANKRVYYKMLESWPEHLLYDFGLAINDSVLAYGLFTNANMTYLDSMTYYVTSIDSILIGNTYQKQWHLSYKLNSSLIEAEQWIDSVGSMSGMLHNSIPLLGNDSYHLLCYKLHDSLMYHYLSNSSCYVITSVDPIISKNETVKISPNPVVDVSLLTVSGIQANNELNIDLYNSFGQKILNKKFTKEIQIFSNELPSGIYFYQVSLKSGSVTSGKIVVK